MLTEYLVGFRLFVLVERRVSLARVDEEGRFGYGEVFLKEV